MHPTLAEHINNNTQAEAESMYKTMYKQWASEAMRGEAENGADVVATKAQVSPAV